MPSTENKQIVLDRISLRYDRRQVLTDVCAEINERDFALIIGPNGGGKTSLLRIVLGLLPPTVGGVSFYRGGAAVPSLDMGYLPQKSRIDSRFPITVSEVVAMGLTGKKLSRDAARASLGEMLARVGMEAYADTPIAALSGGQLQRALFARALITRAEVLVLDEPTSYVDKTFERQMLDMLEAANRTATVLLVSHEADCFAALANRTFRIHATLEEVPQR